jgi:LytR cell envelope-related transcriptional attenuator
VEQAVTSTEFSPPWRRAALVAGGVAVLELVAIVILGLVVLAAPLARTVRSHAAARAAKATSTPARVVPRRKHKTHAPPAKPRVARHRTHVLVLNGNGRQGAAASEAARLQVLGYPVASTGNAARTTYALSLVMFRPGYRAEARRLADDTGIRLVSPLDGLRPRDLRGAQVVEILGS